MTDIYLHAVETGSGPAVCLLHGLFGRMQNLGALARRLAGSHRVISLDLRNHGASPHAAGMAYVDMAADVLHTLSALDALPCAILGHSMGGKVAMTVALIAPQVIGRLVVADIAPLAYDHGNTRIAAALRALPLPPGLDRRAADTALSVAVPDPAIRNFLLQNLSFGTAPAWKIGLQEIAAGIQEIESWPLAFDGKHYDGPVLFIAGGLSNYVTPESLDAIHRFFPQARLRTLPKAGHWLHADQPELFANAVAEFLAGC